MERTNIDRLYNIIRNVCTNQPPNKHGEQHRTSGFMCSSETRVSPQDSLALEEALQAQQTLLPLRPVGAGAVVQDLRHVFRLAQVVWDAPVPGAVGAFRAGARSIAVGVVVGIHARGLEPPPQRLPLSKEKHVCSHGCSSESLEQ